MISTNTRLNRHWFHSQHRTPPNPALE